MSPHCADISKYEIIQKVTKHLEDIMRNGESFAGHKIADLLTVNGARMSSKTAAGDW